MLTFVVDTCVHMFGGFPFGTEEENNFFEATDLFLPVTETITCTTTHGGEQHTVC